mmetsp:Transcript_16777/g.39162  ORF Transcript_16777/g.39162 Transcript_16777/m.39162 type:complete len:231 (-) Transcript_16777:162-854(-)
MPRSQMSKRSIVSYKLESRLKQEETRQLKLKSKLAEQDKLVAGLKRSLAQQQTSRQPASARRVPESAAEASDSLDNLMKVDTASLAGGPGDEELVTRALDALFNWMRLRNYRTIDLFRRRDLNTSSESTMEGDDLLSVEEFKALLEKIPGLKFSIVQVESIVNYLDGDGNGDIDLMELDHAIKKAHRKHVGRDPMHLIAHKLVKNPYSKILLLPTSRAFQEVRPKKDLRS